MSFRAWLSVITLALVAVIIFLSRHELLRAWELLGRVNIWVLLLLIPGQIFVYYTGGEMMFSYLRAKDSIQKVSGLSLAGMALEMNFVNHILPSGGLSGVSYMAWRLGKLGVSSGRATMAQIVRYAVGFIAFILLLLLAVLAVTIDGSINRWIILMSSLLVSVMISVMVIAIYLLSSPSRIKTFSGWLTRTGNKIVAKLTLGRKQRLLQEKKVELFFMEMHEDYLALRHDKRILTKPLLWGIVFTMADVSLFLITFWALGQPVNPAPILIAYGVATIAGFFVITPGGAGAYEAIMVAFLAVAGLDKGTAIAGIVLTRVILLLGTICMGYFFYQRTLLRYGRK
ncbi:MAG TPA: lysylphosphatidylglycerol synthase transmembrane domain-containing protein [Candidatus Saccharimonadales bacterium]